MNGSSPTYTLQQIVERFGGELVGDPRLRIARVATLENAGPDAIAFLANERYGAQARSTSAAAVIVGPGARDATPAARIVCEHPYLYFARVSGLLNPRREAVAGTHPTACVDPRACVHATAEIGPFAVIGARARVGAGTVIGAAACLGEDVSVGRDAYVHAAVTIYRGCSIGDRTVIHSGAVIGADGFGIAPDGDSWVKVPQIGRVRVGDDVEIGANTTIDRGAIDDTIVEDGVKLDNQVQIAHNVRVGAHTAIAACTGIAGSARIGRYCRIGGGVGIAGHVTIADRVEISGHTAVTRSIDAPGIYSGVYPFEPNRDWRKNAVQVRRLADLARRVAALEDELAALRRSRS
jgi:UDP-3-O-[3-hydroxymyristoyl] glucosamine N-acyltransferase